MKLFSKLLLLLLITTKSSFGQDTISIINAKWTNLKTQLQRRTDIVNTLASVLSKSSKVDKEQLKNSKIFAVDLFKFVDTLDSKDGTSISLASAKNNKLIQTLARTLASLENDTKLRSTTEVAGLLMQLEGCENRIALAKQDYNDNCKEFGRLDLTFGTDRVQKATEVKFR